MKKTLIALAAVAATGAAFAQSTVTLGGTIGMQFQKVDGSNGTYGLHDTVLSASVTEDLGGGLKLSAVMNVNNFGGRTKADVKGEDAYISLAGGFGTLKMGDLEAGNGIIGRAYAGAPVIASDDGTILAGASNVKYVGYTSPDMSGFKVSASITSGAGEFAGAAETYGLSYSAGALSAGIDTTPDIDRTRASVSYDFGVAKVGAGIEKRDIGGAGDNYALGVSFPMGALTVGAALSVNNSGGANDGDKAFEVGAAYALSKRTTLSAAYKSVNAAAEVDGLRDTVRVRLTHSF